MATKPAPIPLDFVDNPHAPDVFADGPSGIAYFGGVVRLTFESTRVSHITSPGPIHRVVIGRLAMPIGGAKALRDLLTDYLKKIENQAAAGTVSDSVIIQ
jgi:hypothetical protein